MLKTVLEVWQAECEKQYISDATTFLATDRTSYAKMISSWIYFIFATTFCIGFTQTEKKVVLKGDWR